MVVQLSVVLQETNEC